MIKIGLIVTGGCERLGLAPSLQRHFRDQLNADVSFEIADQVESFTSAPVVVEAELSDVPTTLDRFVRALIAEVELGRFDLVVAVDDLELCNMGQIPVVVSALGTAVRRYLGEIGPLTHSFDERLRTRTSFHLFSPMVEAAFFPEPEAIIRAGAVVPSRFDWPRHDFEVFEVDDADFLRPPDNPNPDLRGRTWAIPERHRHPKAYLKFLAEPGDPTCSARRYRETVQGAAALRELDWEKVLAIPAYGKLARSMIEDIAWFVDAAPPASGTSHEATRFVTRPGNVLRNV